MSDWVSRAFIIFIIIIFVCTSKLITASSIYISTIVIRGNNSIQGVEELLLLFILLGPLPLVVELFFTLPKVVFPIATISSCEGLTSFKKGEALESLDNFVLYLLQNNKRQYVNFQSS